MVHWLKIFTVVMLFWMHLDTTCGQSCTEDPCLPICTKCPTTASTSITTKGMKKKKKSKSTPSGGRVVMRDQPPAVERLVEILADLTETSLPYALDAFKNPADVYPGHHHHAPIQRYPHGPAAPVPQHHYNRNHQHYHHQQGMRRPARPSFRHHGRPMSYRRGKWNHPPPPPPPPYMHDN
ncbi:unnamed protein product [Notodromas monacha]|uniref:Uncharacterized protein n=1 Tax=Notodromas monacha TaxID=399045 RepID=A0A7R9BIZ9_9CRUS|nr:unnamed protein product [Notodromas monacha]CAG0915587.1 unnamed protein product [Notodromas monacha]